MKLGSPGRLVMNPNIPNQYIAPMLVKIVTQRQHKYGDTQTHTDKYACAYMSPYSECKLSVSETTHYVALTPRLRAHMTIYLACQGWKLYTSVIPATFRMIGNKVCRNDSEGD